MKTAKPSQQKTAKPKAAQSKAAQSKAAQSKAGKTKNAKAKGAGKFTVRRVVNWGDCDPAGIIYTPRVLDYACETIDAWLREELKASWWHVNTNGKGPGLPTVNAVCDFISIITPDETLDLTLYIRRVGKSSITFEVEAYAQGERLAFRVKLISCAVDLVSRRATPIPDWMRETLVAYQKSCI